MEKATFKHFFKHKINKQRSLTPPISTLRRWQLQNVYLLQRKRLWRSTGSSLCWRLNAGPASAAAAREELSPGRGSRGREAPGPSPESPPCLCTEIHTVHVCVQKYMRYRLCTEIHTVHVCLCTEIHRVHICLCTEIHAVQVCLCTRLCTGI